MDRKTEYVVYGVHGVCRVLGTEKQLVDRKRTEFLVLEPLEQTGSRFYLPVQNPTAMGKLKPVLTREELTQLLQSDSVRDDCWIPEESIRHTTYRNLLSGADRLGLLQMVSTVYRYRSSQEMSGRKLHLCDENFLRDAEKFLSSEIALVMDLPLDQAKAFLREQLS